LLKEEEELGPLLGICTAPQDRENSKKKSLVSIGGDFAGGGRKKRRGGKNMLGISQCREKVKSGKKGAGVLHGGGVVKKTTNLKVKREKNKGGEMARKKEKKTIVITQGSSR